MKDKIVHIIGAGLAGVEAAWFLANRDIKVNLYEMRPYKNTKAHETANFAELVCSNSFRSDDDDYNAVGLLHHELRQCGSIVMKNADKYKVPAGGALAVDRNNFALNITNEIESHKNINIMREEIKEIPDNWEYVIIATGPLTSDALAEDIAKIVGNDTLSFFDAIAPVIYKESIDFSKAWYQSRYDKGDKTDYINCPMTKEQYEEFINDLITGEKIEFKEWEKDDVQYFEGCLPIEVMAERGVETLRYGPLKPVGLTNPNDPENKPYAIVQLRQDNASDTLRNMVGFQTKLKYGEQKRVFRKIPGLENANFARLGGIHRNTFINSPKLLDGVLRLKSDKRIRFAGQITGSEGYIENASVGFMVGLFTYNEIMEKENILPPDTTSMGCMLRHITVEIENADFQPMNINFGLFPTITFEITENGKRKKLKGRDRKIAYTIRAKEDMQKWIKNLGND